MTMADRARERGISRQRMDQIENPEKARARALVFDATVRGDIPVARACACTDCGKPASEYDHYLGYAPEHHMDVQAVCRRCHSNREQLRHGTCRRGHAYNFETTLVLRTGERQCRECRREREDRKRHPHGKHRPRIGTERRPTSIYLYEEQDAIVEWLIETGYGTSLSVIIRRLLSEIAALRGYKDAA